MLLVLFSLISLVSFQEMVQLSQEGLALDAVNGAGLLNGFTPGRGAAEAVHADGKEQGRSLRRDVQNITDDEKRILVCPIRLQVSLFRLERR